MLLIGQFDSPFVRRVGIALRSYAYDFTHEPYGVFRDAEQIAAHNPLRKVPTLLLDDGTVLTDSFVCLEAIDEQFALVNGPESPRLLLPRSGPKRLAGLRLCGFAAGAAEKAVSLVYERLLHASPSGEWTKRCQLQLSDTLRLLDAELRSAGTPYFLGHDVSHADVAATCALTFVGEAHPDLHGSDSFPALHDLVARCESLPQFQSVRQPFLVKR